MAKAKAAGSFLGGILNNPGALIAIVALGGLIIFRDKISNFFQSGLDNFGKVELPDIVFPEIVFPEFPAFPELPDFGAIFDNLLGGNGHDPTNADLHHPLPTGDTIESANCECGVSSISQDINNNVIVTCAACQAQEPEQCIEIPQLGGGSFNSCTGVFTPAPTLPEDPPFIPPVCDCGTDFFSDNGVISAVCKVCDADPPFIPPVCECGTDFFSDNGVISAVCKVCSGSSGGSAPPVIPGDICSMSLGQIIGAGLASSASAAANLKFEMCELADSDFDFGTNA